MIDNITDIFIFFWYGNNNKHIFIGSKIPLENEANRNLHWQHIWSHIKVQNDNGHGVYYLFETTNLYKKRKNIKWNIPRARIAFQQEIDFLILRRYYKSQYEYKLIRVLGLGYDPQKAQWHKLKRKVILGILGLRVLCLFAFYNITLIQFLKLAFYDFLRSMKSEIPIILPSAIWLDRVDMSKGDLSVFQHGMVWYYVFVSTILLHLSKKPNNFMLYRKELENEGIQDIEKTWLMIVRKIEGHRIVDGSISHQISHLWNKMKQSSNMLLHSQKRNIFQDSLTSMEIADVKRYNKFDA
ncbi:hypothetical protein ACJX0J_035407 [Zea mays]